MTARGGEAPGFVGLTRRTRQALGLAEFVPADRTEVALRACLLLGAEWEAACADERLVDFVVGVVEAVDEFVSVADQTGSLPHDLEGRAEAEAASWLVDFLADGGGAPDREVLERLPDLSASDVVPDDPAATELFLFVLARQVSRALARVLAARPA